MFLHGIFSMPCSHGKLSLVHQFIPDSLGHSLLLGGKPEVTARKIDYMRCCMLYFKYSSFHQTCLIQIKFGKNFEDAQIDMPGYSLYCRGRNKRGGGMAIYAHNDAAISLTNAVSKIEHHSIRATPTKGLPI